MKTENAPGLRSYLLLDTDFCPLNARVRFKNLLTFEEGIAPVEDTGRAVDTNVRTARELEIG